MRILTLVLSSVLLAITADRALADAPPEEVAASPKEPWSRAVFEGRPESEPTPAWKGVLLWVPNRVLDLIDVVKIDVGAGKAFGGVIRISKAGQVGYRDVSPVSVRVGLFGRAAPIMLEHSSEFGIGAAFVESSDRAVCPGELGAGLDVFVGGYAGLCVDELLDFAAGLFLLDPAGDDL